MSLELMRIVDASNSKWDDRTRREDCFASQNGGAPVTVESITNGIPGCVYPAVCNNVERTFHSVTKMEHHADDKCLVGSSLYQLFLSKHKSPIV